jgi:hypothetical protein
MTAGTEEARLGEIVTDLSRVRNTAAVCAWMVEAVTAGMTVAGLLLVAAGATSWPRFLAVGHPDSAIVGLAGGFAGALIVQYRPRNPVGWLLVVNAAGHGLRTLAAEYAAFALVHQHGSLPGGTIASWLATPALVAAGPLFAFAFLRFPDGTLLSRRWRPVEAGLATVLALTLLAVCVLSWPLRGRALLDGAVLPSTPHARVLAAVSNAGQAIVAVALILAALSLVLRYRRASGLVRQQLKWISFGAVPFVVLLIAARLAGGAPGGVLATLSPVALLVTIAVAIRRCRLYDIDRIISRTVAYSVLTVVLAAAFFVVATVVAAMFGLAGGGSPAATAAAAVAVTALFQPLRRRLQEVSDRHFQRRSYEATRIVGAYLDTLRRQEPAAGALTATLRAAVADPSVAVAFWLGDDAYVDEEGNAVDLPSEPQRLIYPVDRAGEHLGVLLLDVGVFNQESRGVLAAVTAAATPAFDHSRLRAKTLVQLAEVRASRTRILAAADKARRRVEQDLHDGAQQRIVAIGLDLGILSSRAERAGQPEMAPAWTPSRPTWTRRCGNCASWPGEFTRPCSPSRASPGRSSRSPSAARCRSMSWSAPSAVSLRSWKRLLTTWWPRAWPTLPSTRVPAEPASVSARLTVSCTSRLTTTAAAGRASVPARGWLDCAIGSRPWAAGSDWKARRALEPASSP